MDDFGVSAQAGLLDPLGPMRLREDLPADELEQSTFLTNARLLLDKLKRSEQRATAKGNLNRDFVRVMAAEMRMPERYREWQPYINISRESDVWPLEILRTVLQVGGLIRKYGGAFRITRRGRELSGEAEAGMLFAHLFRTFFGRFNLAYLDQREDDPLLQATFPRSLWAIGWFADEWTCVRMLRERTLLVNEPEQFTHERELEQGDIASYVAYKSLSRFQTRIVWPLLDFGLLESRVDPDVADPRTQPGTKTQQVRKTSLFDRFVQFGATGAVAPGTEIARLKVTLKDIHPPIWRRIEVPRTNSFRQLSDVIVAAFRWSNSHLHEFEIGKRMVLGARCIGMTEVLDDFPRFFGPPVEDDRTVGLAGVLERGVRLIYRYDFGDGWEFNVLVEDVSPAAEGTVYPRVTHGRRSAPPEDCGGVWGYEEILAALAGSAVAGSVGDGEDAGDAEEVDRLEWLREQFPYFAPEEFDLDAVNEWVRRPEPFWE
jgi:hypothetical protein